MPNFMGLGLKRRAKTMPKGYEKMRDAIKKDLIKKGKSPTEAEKEAKRIAAATWNKRHPKNPVTRKHKSK
jgi:hypothetical protein